MDLFTSYLDQYLIDPDDFVTSMRVQQLAEFFLGTLASCAITAVVIETLAGRQASWRSAFSTAFQRYWCIWTTRLCVGVISVIGLLLFIAPGVYFMVRSIYAESAAVAEGVHGPTAIRISFQLTENRFGETFAVCAIIVCCYVASFLVYLAIMIPVALFVDEQPGTWALNAVLAQVMVPAFIFANLLAYCWYRRLCNLAAERTEPLDFEYLEQMSPPS